MTQLHKIESDHGKNDQCCEYLEVTLKFQNGTHPSLIMKRVSSDEYHDKYHGVEYHGYAQWFRTKADENPDLRNSLRTILFTVIDNPGKFINFFEISIFGPLAKLF